MSFLRWKTPDRFRIRSWTERTESKRTCSYDFYEVLSSRIKIDATETAMAGPHHFFSGNGRAVVRPKSFNPFDANPTNTASVTSAVPRLTWATRAGTSLMFVALIYTKKRRGGINAAVQGGAV